MVPHSEFRGLPAYRVLLSIRETLSVPWEQAMSDFHPAPNNTELILFSLGDSLSPHE